MNRALLLWAAAFTAVAASSAVGCGGGSQKAKDGQSVGTARPRLGDGGNDDQSRCDYRGRADRDAVETAGPGAVQPNVRRVYQLVGGGDTVHKVLVCREIDTNLDGVKDIVRTYNEKGESLREEADTNYDGRIDTWITFSAGRMSKEEIDNDFDGNADIWKYYVDGQLSRIQRDTNRDAKPDRWEFYTAGKLERVGVDLDFDGHVDRWDHDELARLAAEALDRSAQAKTASATITDGGAPAPSVAPSEAVVAPDAGVSKRRKK